MTVMAFDPGDSTGWAVIEWPNIIEFGTVKKDNVFSWLTEVRADVFVVENYRIRPTSKSGWSHQWSDAFALQVIGGIKLVGALRQVPVHLQEPAIKPVASGLTGLPYVKNKKGQHHMDAALHGFYYYIKTLKKDPTCLKSRQKHLGTLDS